MLEPDLFPSLGAYMPELSQQQRLGGFPDLEASVLPSAGQHLQQRGVVLTPPHQVGQQNTVQGGQQAPTLLQLRLLCAVIVSLTVKEKNGEDH